tara:strand:+ start:90 stop:362 length:273 start_codon:yes stop_codon:yes gene_type:complete
MTLNRNLKDLGCTIKEKNLDSHHKSNPFSRLYFEAIVKHPLVSFRVTSRTGVCSQYHLDEVQSKRFHGGFEYSFQVQKCIEQRIKELINA